MKEGGRKKKKREDLGIRLLLRRAKRLSRSLHATARLEDLLPAGASHRTSGRLEQAR